MKLRAAVIQMSSEPGCVAENLERADSWLQHVRQQGVELAVLPELFNSGYGLLPDYTPLAEPIDGPTLQHLSYRSRRWGMAIAAGFVERSGRHLYNSLAFCLPNGPIHVYRKRNLVFWERYRFRPGRSPLIVPTPWGRIGFAICADMIYRRVWEGYRDQIDLAVIASAWPEFSCRETGRQHWLLGRVGPLSAEIPGRVAQELDIPILFANQCGLTSTAIPLLGARLADRFAGASSLCDGRRSPPVQTGLEEGVVISTLTVHPAKEGRTTCPIMSHSASAA